MLLQLRQNTGYMDDHWAAAAAGHVEQGETAYDAARREAREEIGVERPGPDVRDRRCSAPAAASRSTSAIDFFFTARSWTGEPRIVEPDKAPTCGGSRSTALPDPVVPHEQSVLDGAANGYDPAYTTFGF